MRLATVLGVAAALLAWLWPIGIGGRMPVGGDVSQFFLGLMGFLHEALRAGDLPIWNDLWGYGFPGLAESQMGVFYPPHVLLYGRMSTEAAYVASLVLHTLWGGLGAYWASRRMGVSSLGSALAAFAWSSGGFFVIHLAHPWGYTTGSWMPWAWGLAWSILDTGEGRRASRARPFLLSLVLVLQVLPGHFQLAFQTQVTIGLMVLWATVGRWAADLRRRRSEPGIPVEGPGPALRRAVAVIVALAAVLPLAGIQTWPTARLASLAGGQRDFEYLSGFAETPVHLINLVAPGLFHREPAWRPVAWDPFHTSPEECLIYVGLVPLFLAVMAIAKEARRDRAVRLLAFLALLTLFLSLGPYVPGFRRLIGVPGFSFFRAPARWGLSTSLSLAILAGKGLDRWRDWPRPGRALRWLAVAAALWVLAVLGLIELSVWSTARPGAPGVAAWFERGFRAMPWYGDPRSKDKDPRSFTEWMAQARKPAGEPNVPDELSASVVLRKSVPRWSLAGRRGVIYLRELWETALWLVLIGIAAGSDRPEDRRTRAAPALLLLLTFADLWTLGRHRLIDTGPIRPMAEQSRVLKRLADEPYRGARVASSLGNLPILVGAATTSAYRTLTLPTVPSLTMKSMRDPGIDPNVRAALRATGTRLRVFHPVEIRVGQVVKRPELPGEIVEDPALARWLYGASWVAEQGDWVNRFKVWRVDEVQARAWFLPLTDGDEEFILNEWTGDLGRLLPLFDRADPLPVESARPEDRTVLVQADGPGWVIVSQLDDPQWSARWIGLDGQGDHSGEIRPAFRTPDESAGGWQAVEVPFMGRWMLRLTYEPRDLVEGMGISIVAWISWVSCALAAALRRGTRPSPSRTIPHKRNGV